MTQKTKVSLTYSATILILLVAIIGLPTSQSTSKSFAKNIVTFPPSVSINSVAASKDQLYLTIPKGFNKYQIFVGKNLQNLELLNKAAKEMRTNCGALVKAESSQTKKVYLDKSTTSKSPGYFILKNSGVLFYRSKNSKEQALATFTKEYFDDKNLFMTFEANAKKAIELSKDSSQLIYNPNEIAVLKLSSIKKYTVVFYRANTQSSVKSDLKTVVSNVSSSDQGSSSLGTPYPIASEIVSDDRPEQTPTINPLPTNTVIAQPTVTPVSSYSTTPTARSTIPPSDNSSSQSSSDSSSESQSSSGTSQSSSSAVSGCPPYDSCKELDNGTGLLFKCNSDLSTNYVGVFTCEGEKTVRTRECKSLGNGKWTWSEPIIVLCPSEQHCIDGNGTSDGVASTGAHCIEGTPTPTPTPTPTNTPIPPPLATIGPPILG